MLPRRAHPLHKRLDTLAPCVEYVKAYVLRAIYLLRYSSLGIERVWIVLIKRDCVGEFLRGFGGCGTVFIVLYIKALITTVDRQTA